MNRFITRYADQITGTLSGFDRMIFKGSIRALSYAEGMEAWLCWKHILYKDYAAFVQEQSARLKAHAHALAEKAGRPYEHLASPKISKEDRAKGIARRDGIQEGLIAVFGAVEPCRSYSMRTKPEHLPVRLVRGDRQCLFLYFYWMDREFGFMHARIQTWFPFDIQIYINGREWLAQKMDQAGLSYARRDNSFSRLEDPIRTQKMADAMTDQAWPKVFNLFARRINPLLKDILKEQSYYWTLRQGEYATDIMFRDEAALAEIYPSLVDFAIRTFHSEDILRFLGQKRPAAFQGNVDSTLKRRSEGVRVRHTVRENSIKMYDKQGSILRIETTINNPRRFTVYRRAIRKGKAVKAWLPLRQGVVDIPRRVEISRASNARYLEALASIPHLQPSRKVLDPVSQPVREASRRFRPLHPVSPQEALLFASILRGEFLSSGLRNRDLCQHLFPDPPENPADRLRRSGQVTRLLRLLRAHGLLRKLTGTTRYHITLKGVAVMSTALNLRDFNVTHVSGAA